MITTPAWIGLGSNLGDRRATLDAAVAALDAVAGVAVQAVSTYHETRPVGGPTGQGAFLNAAASLETTLGPRELLAIAHEVESQAGRVRAVRWGERTLDVDLLIYGRLFLDTPELKLPHPRMAFRRFVLAPLAEIAPRIVDPVSERTVVQLLANLDHKPRLLVLEGPAGPLKETVFRRLVEKLPAVGIDQNEPSTSDPGWRDRLRRGEEDEIVPTLAVVLPGAMLERRPGVMKVPSLWPESDDPDAIVAEILDTCRAIDGE